MSGMLSLAVLCASYLSFSAWMHEKVEKNDNKIVLLITSVISMFFGLWLFLYM